MGWKEGAKVGGVSKGRIERGQGERERGRGREGESERGRGREGEGSTRLPPAFEITKP